MSEALALLEEALLAVKPGQRCACGGIEGLPASAAAVALQAPAVAVVGSRHPTAQGQDNAQAFARALSEAGVVVVSGLALGVDAADRIMLVPALADGRACNEV